MQRAWQRVCCTLYSSQCQRDSLCAYSFASGAYQYLNNQLVFFLHGLFMFRILSSLFVGDYSVSNVSGFGQLPTRLWWGKSIALVFQHPSNASVMLGAQRKCIRVNPFVYIRWRWLSYFANQGRLLSRGWGTSEKWVNMAIVASCSGERSVLLASIIGLLGRHLSSIDPGV